MSDDTVTLSKEHYQYLLDDRDWLRCLEAAGVDNWQGIDLAYELKQEMEEEDV